MIKPDRQTYSILARLFSGIFLILFLFPKDIVAQTTIYKKDGTQIQVSQIDTLLSTISFKIASEPEAIMHYITQSAIDSIRFENGIKIYKKAPELIIVSNETMEKKFNRNFIGFDLWPYFWGEINAFYEILLVEDKLGFKNKFSYENMSYYGDDENRETFSLTSGINYYFLHSQYFRFGTGIALELGKTDIEDYDAYNYDYNYEGEYRPPPIVREPFRFFYANISFSYILKKKFYTTLELSLPVNINRPRYFHGNLSIIKTELAFNF